MEAGGQAVRQTGHTRLSPPPPCHGGDPGSDLGALALPLPHWHGHSRLAPPASWCAAPGGNSEQT